jgi:hypothetical protein
MQTIGRLARRTIIDTAQYEKNFREGHALGRDHFAVGRFEQSMARDSKANPGFGAGYLAGYRLARIEKERK